MAMNLQAVLRIAAKVTGLEDLGALEKGLMGAEQAAAAAKGGFKAMMNSELWQASAAAAAGIGVALGLAARAAIDFESSIADVRKVVNGLETPKALQEIKAEILDLSRQMPIAAKGFAEIYAAAGQSGIAREDLKEFATLVAQVAVAFDMTAEEAGRSLAQLKVALGLTTPELQELADSMNYVSNNTGSTAATLVEFMSRAGAMGKIAGLTGQQTMAFGAAMIQTGIQSEVAATSFNNMIKALSRGPSMTERQTSALSRLGYSMVNAQAKERELTRVAEEQSRRRLEAARNETDQLSKEINRRYRNQLQALQDVWDDEASAYEDSLQDKTNEQVKSLQRQMEREIKAAQDRADVNKQSADEEVHRIQDAYEERIDALRDATERELTLRRRSSRDKQQQIKDDLDDQKEIELKGIDDKYKAVEVAEKEYLEEARADAKRTGEELAAASSQGFADRLQQNAIGTITEVLTKISNLPKSQQISVLSDLFGDEARGLAPLLSNLGELDRILGLAGSKGEYTGSVVNEFGVRSETAANKLERFRNNLNALAITVGDNILPALVQLADFLGPIIKGIADFAQKNQILTSIVVGLAAGFVGLVALAPFLSSLITLIGQLLPILTAIGAWFSGTSIAATIAGWLGVVGPAIAGITAAFAGLMAWITGTLLPFLVGVFSGPVGWTILAIAAVVAMCIAFREPIMEFFTWLGGAIGEGLTALWEWGEPIRKFWVGVWNGIVAFFSANVIKPIQGAWDTLMQALPKAMDNLGKRVKGVWDGIVNTVKQAIRGMLQNIANNINVVGKLVNRLVGAFNRLPGPDIPFVPTLTVPAFAEGGIVKRPTLAMVGEGGEPEYIIPESKMAAASANYMAGARGSAVINPAGRTGGEAAPAISIQTGPVVEFNGERYVTLADLERGLQQMASSVYQGLRTPAGRYAMGIR